MQLHTKPTQTRVPNKNGLFAATISIFVVPLIKNYSDSNYLFQEKNPSRWREDFAICTFVIYKYVHWCALFKRNSKLSSPAQFTRSSVSWPVQSSVSCDFFLSWWAIQIGFNCLHKPFNSSTYSISRKRHTKIVWWKSLIYQLLFP